ncbi:MAG: hypothetical protein NT089_10225, partial [Planctomycetia bacterium]|nr:hypothetical protein [Planctomycetia bacterium]
NSFQAQFLIPMAAAMAFGEIVTTVLILVMIPVAYSFIGGTLDSHSGEEPQGQGADPTIDPDEGDDDWLPENLRERRPGIKSLGV